MVLQCLWAHKHRLGTCRQRLQCTWTTGMPCRIIISLLFQGCMNLQPLFFNTTTITYHDQPYNPFPPLQYVVLLSYTPWGWNVSNRPCLCVLITHSCVHPHRHIHSIKLHLLTLDLLDVDYFVYYSCSIRNNRQCYSFVQNGINLIDVLHDVWIINSPLPHSPSTSFDLADILIRWDSGFQQRPRTYFEKSFPDFG